MLTFMLLESKILKVLQFWCMFEIGMECLEWELLMESTLGGRKASILEDLHSSLWTKHTLMLKWATTMSSKVTFISQNLNFFKILTFYENFQKI